MVNQEWIEYYVYLEELRQSGETNMFGAAPYLREEFNLGRRESINVLMSWMDNYEELINLGLINPYN